MATTPAERGEGKWAERRRSARIVPAGTLAVAIENGAQQLTSGVVADISKGGACVWTDAGLDADDRLVLRFNLPREPQPLWATARVVWSAGSTQSRFRCGLEWTHTGPLRVRLESLIGAIAKSASQMPWSDL